MLKGVRSSGIYSIYLILQYVGPRLWRDSSTVRSEQGAIVGMPECVGDVALFFADFVSNQAVTFRFFVKR